MMQLLIDALNRIPEFQQLLSALEGGRSPAALSGVAAVHRAHMAAGIDVYKRQGSAGGGRGYDGPLLCVCGGLGPGGRGDPAPPRHHFTRGHRGGQELPDWAQRDAHQLHLSLIHIWKIALEAAHQKGRETGR